MEKKEYAILLEEDDTVYIFSTSIHEISNKLVTWAEKTGVVDLQEFGLVDDLYETTPGTKTS